MPCFQSLRAEKHLTNYSSPNVSYPENIIFSDHLTLSECLDDSLCSDNIFVIPDEDEDIHICGLCRAQFSDVELFIEHKKLKCPVRLARRHNQYPTNATDDPGGTDNVNQQTISTSFQTDQLSHSLHPVVNNVQEQTINDATIGAQLDENTASIEYFPITSAQPENNGITSITQHQYVILPCPTDDQSAVHQSDIPHGLVHQSDMPPSIVNQSGTSTVVDQSSQQTYSGIETVYTLNSPSLQTTCHITDETVAGKISESTPEQVAYRKAEQIYLSNETFAEQMNQTLDEQSIESDAMSYTHTEQPVYYRTSDENLQPVNYSKTDPLHSTESQVIIHNLSDVGVQAAGTMTELPSHTEPLIHDGNQSALKEQLICSRDNMDNTNVIPIQLVNNWHSSKKPTRKQALEAKSDATNDTEHPKQVTKAEKKPPEKKYCCKFEKCTYKSANMKDLDRHSRTHTGEKPFKCDRCGKAFSRTDKLTLHMRYHLDDRVFKCMFCDYSAVENSTLKKHINTHLDERPYSCQVCPYKSRSSSQLRIHLRIHTGDRPYSCKICDAVFKVSSDLHRHIRTHTGEKPFSCNIDDCTYRCAVKSNLRSHHKTHHSKQQEHKCPTCNFVTSSRKFLYEHKKVHESNPELQCKECNYQCANKSALRNHSRMHSTDEKFQCSHCSYSSVQLGNVQAHMKRKHPTKVTRKTRRRGKYDYVENVGKTAEENVADKETKPSKMKLQPKCLRIFKCDQCTASFVREDSLKCHLKQHSESSLSTAYAVLKLQQPVINSSANLSKLKSMLETATVTPVESSNIGTEVNPAENVDDTDARIKEEDKNKVSTITSQSQTIQGASVNLGINDILLAAGMSGLNSQGNSPTNKSQGLSVNTGVLPSSAFTSSPDIQSPESQVNLQNMVVGQSAQTVPSVQVTQNISLPYIRLPNGQVLILTGQTSMNQLAPQADGSIQTDSTSQLVPRSLESQHVVVQCAADSTVPSTEAQIVVPQTQDVLHNQSTFITTPERTMNQQQDAIPIQIILPSDSQQAAPLVSQILNSVINRNSSESMNAAAQSSVVIQGLNPSGSDSVQNYVLQIPPQTGISQDSPGQLAESQNFVLQIPGQSNFS